MKACPTCKETYPTSADYCPRDGTALVDAGVCAEGTVVRGKYRILCKVGEGGMATVYKALHIRFDEMRALKVISPELATDPQFVKRFMQEAVITRKLQHPNAVRVEDIDEAEDGRPFIVMEYIQGQNLKELLQRSNSLPVSQVCRIAKQVAAALDAAHSLGMIHRDIKPSNIILTHTSLSDLRPVQEHVKVLDFGIAKLKEVQAEHIAGSTLTSTGVALGTPAYMSPEQARGLKGDRLDGRSDLYSLGIVMYQMLSGELPFKADTTMEMLIAHIQTPPPPIRSRHPEIPEAIAAVVMRCLEKKPERRPASARELIEEIELAERTPAVTVQPTRPARPSTPAARQAAPEKRRGEGAGIQRDRPQVSVPALVIQASPAKVLVHIDNELAGQTGADGRLEFQRLPLGKRRIRLSSSGYRDHEQFLQISPESTARLTMALQPAAADSPARLFTEDIPPTRATSAKLVMVVSCAILAVVIVVGFWWEVSPHQPEPISVSEEKHPTVGAPPISSPEQPNRANTLPGDRNGASRNEKGSQKKESPGDNKAQKPPTGSVTAPPPSTGSSTRGAGGLDVSPQTLDFNEQILDTKSKARHISIRNDSSVLLAVSLPNGEQDFHIDSRSCSGSLKPGERCEINVTFTPKTFGMHYASLRIETNRDVYGLILSGIGIAPNPSAEQAKETTNAGGAAVQTGRGYLRAVPSVLRIKIGRSAELRLENIGIAPLKIESITITGKDSPDFTKEDRLCLGAQISPGQYCIVTIFFKPLGDLEQARRTATLEIKDNASGSPHIVLLSSKSVIFGVF